MTIIDLMRERHSVRNYSEKKISIDLVNKLKAEIIKCNIESGLKIRLVLNNKSFNCFHSKYGKFNGVSNCILLIGKLCDNDIEEKCGYYGEKLVLYAQSVGLNTCWVATNINKMGFYIKDDEKIMCVITLGYGVEMGKPHKSKPVEKVSSLKENSPVWFKNGVEAALLAPTTLNRQNFYIENTENNKVKLKTGRGYYGKLDLGIVKYHFENAAGRKNFVWCV